MNLINNLEQYTYNDLLHLAEEHPYSSVIQLVLAKKSIEEKKEGENQITKASLRVSNRIVLSNYLEQSSLNVKTEEKEPAPELEEKGDQLIVDQQAEEPEQVETEEIAGDQIIVEENDKNPSGLSENKPKKNKPVFHGFDDDHVGPIGKELVDEGEDDKSVQEDNSHLEGNNRQKVKPEDELEHDDYKIRLGIGDYLDDDDVTEIGEELTDNEEFQKTESEQEKEKAEDNYETVADIQNSQEDSVYKKVVDMLKVDQPDRSKQPDQDHILESEESEYTEDASELVADDYLEDEFEEDETDDDLFTEDTDSSEADEELEELYAQAAYEAKLTQESIEEKEEASDSPAIDKKAENQDFQEPEDKQPSNFIEWINRFSESEEKQSNKKRAKEKKTSRETKAEKQSEQFSSNHQQKDLISREVENQYRDSEEDLDDETTREVQKMAQKSMSRDSSFYTETMAYVYEKQEKWEKAIEVYEQLALKNPEKSSYFANRIKKIEEKTN